MRVFVGHGVVGVVAKVVERVVVVVGVVVCDRRHGEVHRESHQAL